MTGETDFDLSDFLPYALNRAAEVTSRGFQQHYKSRYGMLRTEWRVLFHLGRYGAMTASAICARAAMHKTKVSRAVSALEQKRYLRRTQSAEDRRQETLDLTRQGRAVFVDLRHEAQAYDARLASAFTPEEQQVLRRCLSRIAQG